jgi:hypothetical protein
MTTAGCRGEIIAYTPGYIGLLATAMRHCWGAPRRDVGGADPPDSLAYHQ